MIKIPPFVEALEPYKPGKTTEELAREQNLERIVKLGSGENPLGPSPKAVEAIKTGLLGLNRYSDPTSYDLVRAIAKKYSVQPNHVMCGHGTDSVISYIVSAFTTEDDEILTSEGTFIGIYVNTRKMGRNLIQVPMKAYGFDLEGILKRITHKTRMIYIANPNNPTGTMIGRKEFEAFMERVPDHIMVLLDEAYTVYAAENPDYPNGVTYDYENMVVTRTFSKAYGLAGLRVGFAVGPDKVIASLMKVKLPFEPNNLAQLAAIAALEDDDFLRKTIELNRASLQAFKDCFNGLGIRYVPTHTNFILTLMPDEQFARDLVDNCMKKGLIMRYVGNFGIPNGVRVNSGTMDETRFACEVIAQVYQELKAKSREVAL